MADDAWILAAKACGFRVRRTETAYAAYDGCGSLLIGHAHTLDPEDRVAQLIFHELCHAMAQGPGALERPDWGLDNADAPDLHAEIAALWLQLRLAEPYGLAAWMAPTTEHAPLYAALCQGRPPACPRLCDDAWRNWQTMGWQGGITAALTSTATARPCEM